MNSASDYVQLARECIREAESAQDEVRKETLLSIAKLYIYTALHLEGGDAHPADLRAMSPPTVSGIANQPTKTAERGGLASSRVKLTRADKRGVAAQAVMFGTIARRSRAPARRASK